IFALPVVLEAADDGGREAGRVLAEQRRKRFLEVAGRDAAQVQDRQQSIEASGPTRPFRQDRRGECDALTALARNVISIGAAVANLRSPNRHRTNPGLDRTLRAMAVAHEASPAVA